MATPTANFVSYNSTGMNTIKTDWIGNLCKLAKIDFCSIQEHFKKTKSVDKFFKEQFTYFSSYVIPAFRAENQDRPKGGLVQMMKKNLKIKTERIKTNNFRIQAQILNFPNQMTH